MRLSTICTHPVTATDQRIQSLSFSVVRVCVNVQMMFSFHYYLFAPILEFVFVSTSATATATPSTFCILRRLDVFFFFHAKMIPPK